MGIRDRPTSPRSPWQNAYAERLIGSIRRECTDHVIVFGERHLRHLLGSYLDYYNETRTHLSLDKDAPISRAIQAVGRIVGCPVLSGLHHQYVRIEFAPGTGRSSRGTDLDRIPPKWPGPCLSTGTGLFFLRSAFTPVRACISAHDPARGAHHARAEIAHEHRVGPLVSRQGRPVVAQLAGHRERPCTEPAHVSDGRALFLQYRPDSLFRHVNYVTHANTA